MPTENGESLMNRAKVLLIFGLLIALTLSSCTLNRSDPSDLGHQSGGSQENPGGQPQPQASPTGAGQNPDFDFVPVAVNMPATVVVEGQVLIKFKQTIVPELPTDRAQDIQGLSIGSTSLDPTLQTLGITSLEPLLAPTARVLNQDITSFNAQAGPVGQLYIAEFDASKNAIAVAETLSANADVEYAEPNYVAFITGEPSYAPQAFTPNDPFFRYQWNFSAVQMETAWNINQGSGVTVAVLDTGVAYEDYNEFRRAPDLAGTRFTAGYDYVNNDTHPNDDQGHGTHVAGTIAQTTNNGVGTSGIAYRANIMPIKVLDRNGQGGYDNIIKGINYAVFNGAKVINLSLAGNSPSRALEEAINDAKSRGVTIVAATGNSGGAIGYPAIYANAIAVGAIRFDQTRARYSNFGPQIDLVAPGGDNNIDQNGDSFGDGIVQQTFKAGEINNFRYLFFEGTSMAAPHVSGVIALMLSARPSMSPSQIESVLKDTAKDLGRAGFDEQTGFGLVQAANALGGGVPPSPVTPTTMPATPVTPGPTPTSEPTVTPGPPPPSSGALRNNSFEGNEAWEFQKTPRRGQYSTAQAHSGSRSALVGIIDPAADTFSFSSVAQKVTIPANASKVTLTAHIYPVSQDIGGNNNAQAQHGKGKKPHHYRADQQVIAILSPGFREIERLHSDLSNSQTWEQKTFDLTHYRGSTVYIYFGAVNRDADGRPTAMYVDDVTLSVTP